MLTCSPSNFHTDATVAAKEETNMLWSYTNAAERARVSDFFACFSSPRWRLEEVRDNGTEAGRRTTSRTAAAITRRF